jgi:hypothetical protein
MWICKLSSAYLWKYVKYFDIRDICSSVKLEPFMKQLEKNGSIMHFPVARVH